MREILPSDLLHALMAVEGRYIQWEWEPQTLTNDYITLREATGYPVVQHDKTGRELSIRVSRGSVQSLISEHSVYEDELKRGSGLRILPADGGWTVALRFAKAVLNGATALPHLCRQSSRKRSVLIEISKGEHFVPYPNKFSAP